MIMWIPQLICCGIHMKREMRRNHAAPRAGRAIPAAYGPHRHHAALKSTALRATRTPLDPYLAGQSRNAGCQASTGA
jgi:hypothetical protein